MRIVVISDTHTKHRDVCVPIGDIIIHCGDYCNRGTKTEVVDFLNWFKDLNYKHKILISGNHDNFAAVAPNEFKELLSKEVTYLNNSGIEINNIKFWGSPSHGQEKEPFGEEKNALAKKLEMLPKDTDVLITHVPPKGILSTGSNLIEMGCKELEKRVATLDIGLHLFGHAHASYGQQKIKNTHFINASNYSSKKGIVNPAFVIEIQKKTTEARISISI